MSFSKAEDVAVVKKQEQTQQRLIVGQVVTPDRRHRGSLDVDLATPDEESSPPPQSVSSSASFNSFQLLLLSLMVAQNSGVVLATRYSHTSVVETHKKYTSSNLVLAIEAAKLLLCVIILGLKRATSSMSGPLLTKARVPKILISLPFSCSRSFITLIMSLRHSLPVVPIALLYLIQNNILYIALANLPAPLFQLCYQTKLVTTAVLSVIMIKERR